MVAPLGAGTSGLMEGFQFIANLKFREHQQAEEQRQFNLTLQLQQAALDQRIAEDKLATSRQEREMARLDRLAQLQEGQFQLGLIEEQRKLKGAEGFGVDTGEEQEAIRGLRGLQGGGGGQEGEVPGGGLRGLPGAGGGQRTGQGGIPNLGARPKGPGISTAQRGSLGGLPAAIGASRPEPNQGLPKEPGKPLPTLADQEVPPYHRWAATAGEGSQQEFGGITYIATERDAATVQQLNEDMLRQHQIAASQFDEPKIAVPNRQYVSIPGARQALRNLRQAQIDQQQKAREDTIQTRSE